MRIANLLAPETVITQISATSKEDAISQLVAGLARVRGIDMAKALDSCFAAKRNQPDPGAPLARASARRDRRHGRGRRLRLPAGLPHRRHPAREWLYLAYDAAGKTLFSALRANPGYSGIKAPGTIWPRPDPAGRVPRRQARRP